MLLKPVISPPVLPLTLMNLLLGVFGNDAVTSAFGPTAVSAHGPSNDCLAVPAHIVNPMQLTHGSTTNTPTSARTIHSTALPFFGGGSSSYRLRRRRGRSSPSSPPGRYFRSPRSSS